MKTLILSLVFLMASSSFAASTVIAAKCSKKDRLFYFNMPLIIGKTIFNDQVEICKIKGKLSGQLTVPKRFTAKLENIKHSGRKLEFSITADEGNGKFSVFYKGKLKEKNKFFIGVAKLKDDKILGPFMGVSSKEKMKLKVVQ